MERSTNNMVAISQKLFGIVFMLVIVLGLSSYQAKARRLAKFEEMLPSGPSTWSLDNPLHHAQLPSKIDNFGMLPSGPSTWSPNNPPHHAQLLSKTNNVGTLPSRFSTSQPSHEISPPPQTM